MKFKRNRKQVEYINLVEIRLPKKFSVCIYILISSQALSKVFCKFKSDPPPRAFQIIFWAGKVSCGIKEPQGLFTTSSSYEY